MPGSGSQSMNSPRSAMEDELAARIAPWLEHMRWRPDFEEWRERRLFQERYQEEHIARLREVASDLAGRAVLDLGAGMGGFAVALAREGARVTALEFNGDYCQIIALRGRRYGLGLAVVQGAGEDLPLPAEAFDLVCSWDVLEHVQDPRAVLREAWRVLRPEGAFLLTAINRRAWRDPHYHLPAINWLPRPWAEALIRRAARGKQGAAFADRQALVAMHYFTWGALCRLARGAGFRVEDLQEKRLAAGTLVSRRPERQRLRRLLRALGLERLAYRAARALYLPFFEVVLWKTG
jgi:ubiquinone/menaquinone biosynthesis C-methylase UbiE